MQHLLIIGSLCCFFIGLIIFLQSMNNAFKKHFLWGFVYLLFPIGSYFYYRKFIDEEKNSAVGLTVCLLLGTIIFLIVKFL